MKTKIEVSQNFRNINTKIKIKHNKWKLRNNNNDMNTGEWQLLPKIAYRGVTTGFPFSYFLILRKLA